MGVDIYGTAIDKMIVAEKDIDDNTYDALLEEYGQLGRSIVKISKVDQYTDWNPKFQKGIYLQQSEPDSYKNWLGFSYSGYADFLMIFERMSEELEDTPHTFMCVEYQTIDGTYDYSIAEEILNELTEYYTQIVEFIRKWEDDGGYGEFMENQLNNYIKHLKYCVKVKGVMVHK